MSDTNELVERLTGFANGTFQYKVYRGKAPDGVPQLRSDILALVAALAPVEAVPVERCTICGFVVDTRYAAEKPQGFGTAGRTKVAPPAQAGAVTEAMVEVAAQKLQPQDWGSMEPWEQAVARSRAEAALTAALGAQTPPEGAVTEAQGWRPTGHVQIPHDGFAGDIIGHYTTREGKRGVVVQQDGTRVVHVYGEKWLTPPANQSEGAGE